jgi:ubiquinone biosynthesis protein Coq4
MVLEHMARDHGLRPVQNRSICVHHRSSYMALRWKEQHSSLGN